MSMQAIDKCIDDMQKMVGEATERFDFVLSRLRSTDTKEFTSDDWKELNESCHKLINFQHSLCRLKEVVTRIDFMMEDMLDCRYRGGICETTC